MQREDSPLIAFNKARLNQYATRKGLTLTQAKAALVRIFGSDYNQKRVDEEVDPVVDEEFRSHKRPKPSA